MQVCGPVLRTQVDIVFPFAYNKKTAPTAGRTIKRKLEREAGMVVPSQSQMSIIPSWIPSRPTISQVAHSGKLILVEVYFKKSRTQKKLLSAIF